MSAILQIGTCAWAYDDWRGAFYPPGVPHHAWLAFYARHFGCVEVDATFYHAPAARAVAHWAEQTPDDFRFACKVPREITHEGRLRDSREKMDVFLQALAPLGEKLACVLILLPPGFSPSRDEAALRDFVRHLPPSVRFAIEFRKREWHLPRIVHLLEEHRLCWVWNDLTPLADQNRAPFDFLPQTTDFLYVRLMGDVANKYRRDGSRIFHYTHLQWLRETAMESWAMKIQRHLAQTNRALVLVSNHFEGFAPASCQRLGEKLGIKIELPPPAREQSKMEKNSQLDLL